MQAIDYYHLVRVRLKIVHRLNYHWDHCSSDRPNKAAQSFCETCLRVAAEWALED